MDPHLYRCPPRRPGTPGRAVANVLWEPGCHTTSGTTVGLICRTHPSMRPDIELFADPDMDMIIIDSCIRYPERLLPVEAGNRYLGVDSPVPLFNSDEMENGEVRLKPILSEGNPFCMEWTSRRPFPTRIYEGKRR